MCCSEASTVYSIGEEVKYKDDKTNIEMPVSMDDVGTAGQEEHIRKDMINCAKIEKENR